MDDVSLSSSMFVSVLNSEADLGHAKSTKFATATRLWPYRSFLGLMRARVCVSDKVFAYVQVDTQAEHAFWLGFDLCF